MASSVAEDLVDGLLRGERRALARAISLVENGDPEAEAILEAVYPRTGQAFVLGVTGAPGVGKSTLVSMLIPRYRQRGLRVGVVAVDPSSPFSGGAILGDRIRLSAGPRDPDVFFRSLANRGHTGGVSRATHEVIALMDAAGFEVIILETVGAGQSEIDVMRLAHTVLVVTAPGLGDEVQAFKAGILEIGDVFVVNKADRDGAERTAAELRFMLSLAGDDQDGWRPEVVRTVAQTGEGADALLAAIDRHREYLTNGDRLDRRARDLAERQLRERVGALLLAAFREAAGPGWRSAVESLSRREATPNQVVQRLLGDQRIWQQMMKAMGLGSSQEDAR